MFALLMGVSSVTPAVLHERVSRGDVAVFDVNSPQSWGRAHVPGARNLDPESFVASDLPEDRSSLLVFYCSNPMCRKAPIAARRAKAFGYVDARVMSAGIRGWVSKQFPTEAA